MAERNREEKRERERGTKGRGGLKVVPQGWGGGEGGVEYRYVGGEKVAEVEVAINFSSRD